MASTPFRATPKFGANLMLEKILVASRGNLLPGGSTFERPICPVAGIHKCDFAAEATHV